MPGPDSTTPPGAPPATPTGPTGPETSLPGAKELAETQARRAEAERAANQQAVTNARTEMEAAERAYHSAVASRAAREGAEANESLFEEFTDWYSNRDKTEAALLRRAYETEERTLRAYRAAVSRYVTARLLLTASEERANELSRISSEVNENAVASSHFESIERVIGLPEKDRNRISTLANARARMRTARIFHEAIALAGTRINPGSGGESTLVKQLDYLAGGIRDTRRQREYQYNESQAHYDTREWFRDTERDLKVETAVTLAEQGTVLDPRDGTVLRGDALRARFAADRIQWMADFLDQASWRRNDPRSARATELRRHLKEAYATLDYLGHGTVPMREFFSAASLTIRQRQDEVNTWFIKDYLGLPTESTGTWWDTIKVGWSVKLGTSGRVAGFGEQNIEVVRQRIYTMNLQADHAVDALKTAAETPDPDDLPENIRDLLETYGYIEVREDGTSVYVIPTADTLAQRVTTIDRPGASWLDVVSVQNAGEILVSVALPELASARVAAIATRLGVSVRAVRAATILTDQFVGLATDVAFNYAHSEPGKFNLASSALESLAMSWVGLLSRTGSDLVVNAIGNRTIGRLIADDTTRKQVIGVISELMGVPVDTVQQIAFNAAKGQTVTSDDVLAALLGSAMNAVGSRAGKHGAESVEHALSLLPRDLRERSILLAPNDGLRRAIETDARLNERAERRFDSAVGDGAMDRGTGSRIFEALRLGELTWSELQRVYTIRGSEMDTVMDQVRLDRDRFVRSVVSAARVLATDMITRHYDEQMANATTTERRRELTSERQAELAKIADLQFESRLNDSFASKAMEVAGESRAALLDRLRGDEATMKRVGGEDGLASLSDDQLRDLAFNKLESEYLDAFGKAGDVIQPGSAGATSDVDRSWASEWLRRAAKAIVQAEMTRARMDTELGPTTASAFDVNEYNNVMSRIKSVILHRSEFAGLDATTVTIRRPDGSTADVTLNHADTVEANSLAAAMLHMSAERRDRFQSNVLGSSRGADRDRLIAMFTHAKEELASSDSLLTRYTQEEAARSGTSVDDPDTQLRARDRLYGERMMELDRIGLAIDRAPEGSRERAELMATWERLMNTALRDGIETYSDMANLDIIVSRMQSAKKPDGSKYSPEELMRLPEFRLGEGGLLSHVSEQQVRSMLNDQVLMIMHHVEAYHHGHESAAKATRSLAKYAERALLALSLLGQFHPDTPGKYKDLFEATRSLLRNKDNPQALLRTLGSLGPGRGDPHQSLRWYLDQIETLPGMAGLTSAPVAGRARLPFNSTAARRDWERRKRAAEANGMLPQVIGVELINTMQDLQATERELNRMRALREFRSTDRAEAARSIALAEELRIRLSWLSGSDYAGPHWRSMQTQMWEATKRVEELKRAWVAAGRPDDDGWAARIADMEERVDGLRERERELQGDLQRLRRQPAAR